MRNPYRKISSPEDAIGKISDNSVLAISGFNIATTPEYLILKLYENYEKTGHPKNLFIISDTYPGIPGRGLDFIVEKVYKDKDENFIRGMLIPFLGWSPWLQKLVIENKIEMYSWSIGIAAYWFREVGCGRPGLISKVGIDTFLDPRQDGGAMNELSRERKTCWVDVMKIHGEEYLFYHAPKPNVAFIRGTTSDEIGNISMEKEGIIGTVLNIAQATKSQPSSGFVIAQVERVARFGSINPRCVQVPGPLVDYVIISPEEYHWQTGTIKFDPRICGRIIPPILPELTKKLELDINKVIARRIAMEMTKIIKEKRRQIIVNLGIGIPTYVANIAAEEEIADYLAITIESGPWGGIALTGVNFGVSIGPFAIISLPDQFSLYEGGIIDATSLGFMQVDKNGNVNPSMLPGRIPGPGGFSVITTGSPVIYFGGGFTAGKKDIRVKDGKLNIVEDGKIKKFVSDVYKIVFNGKIANMENKEILYITERGVFRLSNDGLVLEEYAPGIDIDGDIIEKMDFEPKISENLREMDKRLFFEEKLNIKKEIIGEKCEEV